MRRVSRRTLAVLLALWSAGVLADTDWPDADTPQLEASGGELRFLTQAPAVRSPQSQTQLIIGRHSLQDGWVALIQCHADLDPFPKSEIAYRYRRMRGLRLLSSRGIGRAWIEGQSVQLRDARPGARVCVQAEAGILHRRADGGFELVSGPYHRHFLDAYYPLRLTLTVRYPATRLRLTQVEPAPQAGLTLTRRPGELHMDGWFVGLLTVKLRFAPVARP